MAMDEQPIQLYKDVRKPIPATKNHSRRPDDEYERAGVTNIFMFTEPLGGRRRASVREYKTTIDWTHEVKILLEGDFPNVKKVILVCDNFRVTETGAFVWIILRNVSS